MTKRKHEEVHNKSSHRKKQKHDSDFSIIHASTVVSIPPIFASNPREGVLEMLDSMIMRYIPSLEGVVLTHSNLQFLQSTALIQYDSPYAKCNVAFDATVWNPRVGQRLTGKVILCSPDHISLLIHRIFNVSIPRHHIPTEKCSFQWGPAEKVDGTADVGTTDVEGEDVVMANGNDASAADVDADVDVVEGENLGSWIDNETKKPLGPMLEFTVIGLTIANQMISIIGSLQPDPFSTRHVPPAAASEKEKETVQQPSQEEQATSPGADLDTSEDEDVKQIKKKKKKKKTSLLNPSSRPALTNGVKGVS